jgi:CRP-like cAMP-binding protein
MVEIFRTYLNQFIQLDEFDFQAIMNVAIFRRMSKKEHLVIANEVCNKFVFFRNGYFRSYHKGNETEKIAIKLCFAPGFATSYMSFLTGNPSPQYVQAMADMEVLEFSKNDLHYLYSMYPSIERLGRLITELVFIESGRHLLFQLSQIAKTK